MTKYFRAKKHLVSLLSFLTSFVMVFASHARAVEIVISGNGEGTVNEVVVQQTQEVVVEQTNEASIVNEVGTEANTGNNTVSDSTGETTIETGDSATEVFVENAVNESNVVVECCSAGVDVTVSENGAGSQNSVNLGINDNTNVSVNQSADIVNNISGTSNTGDNSVSDSSGDATIRTGDINVVGGVSNGPINVVNVSGSSGGGGVSVNISGNAVDSVNNVFLALSNYSGIQINHFTDVRSSVNWDLNTGGNEVNGSTGNVEIETGDIFLDFFFRNDPINVGGVDWDCCGDTNKDPEDSDDPDDPNGPGDPGGGGIGGGSGNNNSGNGSSSSSSSDSSSSTNVGGISILGLSDTSSAQAQSIIFFAGLLMMLVGFKLFGEEFLGIIHPINAK